MFSTSSIQRYKVFKLAVKIYRVKHKTRLSVVTDCKKKKDPVTKRVLLC